MNRAGTVLVIACGALAHEIKAVTTANGWDHVAIQCLPADLHNTPDRIPSAVREQIHKARSRFEQIFVAYGDCGTGGLLDRVLEAEGVERIPGAHCYEFFAGSRVFQELHEREIGTLYLTDFLARHFERIIIRGLGIDRHPELESSYFGNYRRLVYLSQREDAGLVAAAHRAAERLGLDFEHRPTGYSELGAFIRRAAAAGSRELASG